MKRLILLVSLLALAAVAQAETVKGRIAEISKKAGTIQIDVKGEGKVVVRTDANTRYEGAAGLKELGPPDLIEVQREPGKAAASIRKVVFGLPPGVEIDTRELLGIMTGGQPYHLYDARPAKRFGAAHIPSAESAFPKEEGFLAKLPEDKNTLLVFYCGGPTCPYTGEAVEKAQKVGYTNLKGYQLGLPGWKKAKLPVHSEAAWLAKNLDPQHVVLDVRPAASSSRFHIKGAAALPLSGLQAMTERFIAEQKVPQLPGVRDMRAPVVIYADSHTSREALLAYKELRNWGYKKASILKGGFDVWQAASLPTESGAASTQIVYEKKLAPGAIAPQEFRTLEEQGENVVLVDVRTDQEVAGGKIEGARHIALEDLEDKATSLPRDKEILIYCANGIRAEMGYQMLKNMGFKTRYLNETIAIDKDGSYTL